MSTALDGYSDLALGEALKRCMADLGEDAEALARRDASQLGATLRRHLPAGSRFDGIGFHRSADAPDTLAQGMGRALLEWWQALQDNTGDRAALRRADSLVEVVSIPAFHQLRWRIDALLAGKHRRLSVEQDERLAVVAALAARVREPRGGSRGFIGQMAGVGQDKAPVSELRFRRLLQAETPSDLFRQLRRVLAMLGEDVDLLAMADDAINWGERRRKRWAYAYYGLAQKRA